jgi:hypothetical protein
MNTPSRPRFAVLGPLLAAVFVAGVAVGVIGDRLAAKPGAQALKGIRISRGVTPVYLDRLELTQAQRVRVDSILARRAPPSESLMFDVLERMHSVALEVDSEIRLILTPTQRARLDSLRGSQPQMMLKRKVVTPGGTSVDTVVVPRRDTVARPR